MRAKRILGWAIVLFAAGVSRLEAQPARVEGTVRGPDEIPIRGAYVLIEQSRFTAVTDLQGHFAIDGPEVGFTGTISVTYPEYRQEKRKLTLTEAVTTLTFTLQPRIKPEPVVTQALPLTDAGPGNRVTLATAQVVSLPGLWQQDAPRAIQLLPRVTHQETTSGLPVRGGSADETLMRLDGITLYDTDRLFGYTSALDMHAIDSVQFGAGPFDARTGGRLSGAADIVGRTGDPRRSGGSATVTLLDIAGLAEMPLGGKGSGLVSARRSYESPMSRWILTAVDGVAGKKPDPATTTNVIGSVASQPTSEFFDLHGKLLVQPTSSGRASVTVYRGLEDLDLSRDSQLSLDVTDLFAALGISAPSFFSIAEPRHALQTGVGGGWSHVWSDRVQTELSAARTTFDHTHQRTVLISGVRNTLDEKNTVEERIGRGVLTLTLGGGNTVDVGAEVSDQQMRYTFANAWVDTLSTTGTIVDPLENLRDPSTALTRADTGRLASVFAQHRLFLQNRVSLTPGVRLTRFDRTGEWYSEPHVFGRVHLNEAFSVQGGWGRAYQFTKQVEREDLLRGNRRFWALADGAGVAVASSKEFVGGASYSRSRLLIDVQAFKKELEGLTIFSPVVVGPADLVRLANPLARGTGTVQGLEALVQVKAGPNTTWGSYTRSDGEQDFPAISPRPFPSAQHRAHEIKVADSARFGAFTLAGIWTWSTGRPYTPVIQTVSTIQPPIPEGEETPPPLEVVRTLSILAKHSGRLPNHHRLDLSFTRGIRIAGKPSIIGGSVQNLYNRANAWYKEYTSVGGEVIEADILMMTRAFNVFWTIKF